jgi:hypothetical protein
MVMAITSFLQELQLGELKTFITHEKKVILTPTEALYVALVVDLDDLDSMWQSRAAAIGSYIESHFSANLLQSRVIRNTDEGAQHIVDQLLYTEDEARFVLQDIRDHLFSIDSLFGALILENDQVKHKLVKQEFEDFELVAFIESPFADRMLIKLLPSLEQSFETLKIGTMNYCRIETMMLNIFLFKITSSLYTALFLDKEHDIPFAQIRPLFERLDRLK